MFIVVSQSDIHIGFGHQFLRARKDGNLERNLSNPDLAELMVNNLTKNISKNIYQYFFFYPIYHSLL